MIAYKNRVTGVNDVSVGSAFENCTNLEKVTFANNSMLKEISDNAFYGCTKITELKVPSSVEKIGNYAFAYCVNLIGEYNGSESEFVLSRNLKAIGNSVFLSTNISNISIDSNNENFIVFNSTLYDKNITRLIVSYAKNAFVVPSSVQTIEEYAFFNNNDITSINLSNVERINDYAFLNCTKLESVSGGSKVKYVNREAFTSTKWLDNNDIIILGSVLIKYNNETNTKYKIPSDVVTIGNSAFASKKLTEVVIPSNVRTIKAYAFTDYPNLLNVYMLRGIPTSISKTTFLNNKNLKIYVPSLYINDYKNDSSYSNYVMNIVPKWIRVELLDGINLVDSVTVKFYSILSGLDELEKDGYDFVGWYCDETGKIYKNGSIFDIYEGPVTFSAVFEKAQYKIYLNFDDADEDLGSYTIGYGESFQYPVPVKEGYIFIGWFDGNESDSLQYSNEKGESLFDWNNNDSIVLFARFEKKQFNITDDLNGGVNSPNNPSNFLADETIELDSPMKYGYEFLGWTLNGSQIIEIKEGTYQNITLVAHWEAQIINGTTNSNEYLINAEYTIIYCDNLSTTANNTFNIENNVKQVTFISSENKKIKCVYKR
ncbi:MAG: leucine-rich repeat protein [Bacilli bacterium]|nr:leucine-rich repeat protein [Bacilli bacterium]